MRHLCLVVGLTATVLAAQTQSQSARPTWSPPRTPEGHPDFQGVWVNNIATPLERPEALAGRATLTDQELAAMKRLTTCSAGRATPPLATPSSTSCGQLGTRSG
jgi:hypothetical protein